MLPGVGAPMALNVIPCGRVKFAGNRKLSPLLLTWHMRYHVPEVSRHMGFLISLVTFVYIKIMTSSNICLRHKLPSDVIKHMFRVRTPLVMSSFIFLGHEISSDVRKQMFRAQSNLMTSSCTYFGHQVTWWRYQTWARAFWWHHHICLGHEVTWWRHPTYV